MIGKLYANSLLATLNTRYSVRARAQSSGSEYGSNYPSNLSNKDGLNGNGAAASGVDHYVRHQSGGGAVFSTVIQMGVGDEESLGDEASLGDEESSVGGNGRSTSTASKVMVRRFVLTITGYECLWRDC